MPNEYSESKSGILYSVNGIFKYLNQNPCYNYSHSRPIIEFITTQYRMALRHFQINS